MKLTNKMNLPDAIVQAVKNDPYSRGDADYSCTGLLAPPRKAALVEAFESELEEDVSDRLWSAQGQLMHLLLERANRPDKAIAEKRLFGEFAGARVSAQFDNLELDGGVITDYKYQSSYKFKKYEVDPDWTAQLNIQAELVRRAGHTVNALQIIGLLRDWSKGQADRDPNYPQRPVAVVSIELWPSEKVVKFVEERITLHRQARVRLPLCTPGERWESPTVFAVMKKGRKSALRLLETKEEADAMAAAEGAGHTVIHRIGESKRCQNFCSVSKFCTQYQESIQPKTEELDHVI